jgi:HAD superfamily hydrolase (TIGR01509 family)
LLFDFDGVLADSEPVHFRSWSEVLKPLGFSFTWEYYQNNFVGVSDDLVLTEKLKLPGGSYTESLISHKREIFRAMLDASPPFPQDTILLIAELSASYRLAVVSSSARTEVEPPLVRAGLRHRFELLVTWEDVERVKPDPEPYLKAAKLLGALSPLIIEDSTTGVAAAKASGFEYLRVSGAVEMAAELRQYLERRNPRPQATQA